MRHLPLALLPLLVGGCWGDTSYTAYKALDYHVDRPRVAAVSVHPERPNPLEDVTIDALVLVPLDASEDSTVVDTCGVTTEYPTIQWDATCFLDEDAVETIDEVVPAAWVSPDYSDLPCLDTWWSTEVEFDTADTAAPSCHASVPFRVTSRDSKGRVGAGLMFRELSLREGRAPRRAQSPRHGGALAHRRRHRRRGRRSDPALRYRRRRARLPLVRGRRHAAAHRSHHRAGA